MKSTLTRDRALLAVTVLIAVVALILVLVADGLTRVAMVLVIVSCLISIGLAVARLRRQQG